VKNGTAAAKLPGLNHFPPANKMWIPESFRSGREDPPLCFTRTDDSWFSGEGKSGNRIFFDSGHSPLMQSLLHLNLILTKNTSFFDNKNARGGRKIPRLAFCSAKMRFA
jgi:hypothetical protein